MLAAHGKSLPSPSDILSATRSQDAKLHACAQLHSYSVPDSYPKRSSSIALRARQRVTHQRRLVRERSDAGQAAHALAARKVWQRLVALLRRQLA